jgi:hypothetical protein
VHQEGGSEGEEESASTRRGPRRLTHEEWRALGFGAGLVGVLSGVAQFLASYVKSGLMLLGLSAGVVVIGLVLTIAAMRGWHASKRKLALSLNVIVLAAVILVVLGGIGGVIGRSVGVWARPSPSNSARPFPSQSTIQLRKDIEVTLSCAGEVCETRERQIGIVVHVSGPIPKGKVLHLFALVESDHRWFRRMSVTPDANGDWSGEVRIGRREDQPGDRKFSLCVFLMTEADVQKAYDDAKRLESAEPPGLPVDDLPAKEEKGCIPVTRKGTGG